MNWAWLCICCERFCQEVHRWILDSQALQLVFPLFCDNCKWSRLHSTGSRIVCIWIWYMRFGVYGVVATANLIIWWSVRSIRGGPPPIFPYIWLCECLTGVTSATARIGALLLIGGLHWCAWPLESENELPAIYGARGTRSEKKRRLEPQNPPFWEDGFPSSLPPRLLNLLVFFSRHV